MANGQTVTHKIDAASYYLTTPALRTQVIVRYERPDGTQITSTTLQDKSASLGSISQNYSIVARTDNTGAFVRRFGYRTSPGGTSWSAMTWLRMWTSYEVGNGEQTPPVDTNPDGSIPPPEGGGTATGGESTAGTATAGTATGGEGTATGGESTAGTATAGTATGGEGTSTGGESTAGTATAGTSTGGTATGGESTAGGSTAGGTGESPTYDPNAGPGTQHKASVTLTNPTSSTRHFTITLTSESGQIILQYRRTLRPGETMLETHTWDRPFDISTSYYDVTADFAFTDSASGPTSESTGTSQPNVPITPTPTGNSISNGGNTGNQITNPTFTNNPRPSDDDGKADARTKDIVDAIERMHDSLNKQGNKINDGLDGIEDAIKEGQEGPDGDGGWTAPTKLGWADEIIEEGQALKTTVQGINAKLGFGLSTASTAALAWTIELPVVGPKVLSVEAFAEWFAIVRLFVLAWLVWMAVRAVKSMLVTMVS